MILGFVVVILFLFVVLAVLDMNRQIDNLDDE
jgi:hypothetical protein